MTEDDHNNKEIIVEEVKSGNVSKEAIERNDEDAKESDCSDSNINKHSSGSKKKEKETITDLVEEGNNNESIKRSDSNNNNDDEEESDNNANKDSSSKNDVDKKREAITDSVDDSENVNIKRSDDNNNKSNSDKEDESDNESDSDKDSDNDSDYSGSGSDNDDDDDNDDNSIKKKKNNSKPGDGINDKGDSSSKNSKDVTTCKDATTSETTKTSANAPTNETAKTVTSNNTKKGTTPTECSRCALKFKDNSDYIRLHPCHCCYCLHCMIQFFAERECSNNGKIKKFQCWHCQEDIQAHQALRYPASGATSENSEQAGKLFHYTNNKNHTTTATKGTQTTPPTEEMQQQQDQDNKDKKKEEEGTTTKKKRRKYIRFVDRVKALLAYKEKHGNFDNMEQRRPVGGSGAGGDDSLASWVYHIRHGLHEKLNPQQKEELFNIGFDWRNDNENDNDTDEDEDHDNYKSSVTTKKRKYVTFDERVQALIVHKEKYGNFNIRDPSLRNWAKNIRDGKYKITKEEKLKQLNDIGFFDASFDTTDDDVESSRDDDSPAKASAKQKKHDKSKRKKLNDKKKKKNGTSNNDSSKESSDESDDNDKENNNDVSSPPKKKFKYVKFQQRVDDLIAYKEIYGHFNVDIEHADNHESLAHWVKNIRNGKLTIRKEEHKKQLDQIGFDWKYRTKKAGKLANKKDNDDDDDYDDDDYSHDEETTKKKPRKNNKKGSDAAGNKEKPAKSKTTPSKPKTNRKRKRDEAGLDDSNGKDEEGKETEDAALDDDEGGEATTEARKKGRPQQFDKRFEELVVYHKQYNTFHVAEKHDKALAGWVRKVRRRDYNLSKEQDKRLEEIGFCWESKKAKSDREWEINIVKLKEYHAKHGDYQIPEDYEDKELVDYVKNKLCPKNLHNIVRKREDRKEILMTMGYLPKKRKTFEERMEELKEYKALHGNLLVPYRYSNLGEWVKDVRRGHIKITKEQRRTLSMMGFNWETRYNKLDREWIARFEKLKEVQSKDGGRKRWKFEEDKSLSEWVNTQRRLFSKKILRDDRKKLLDEIGFVWPNTRSTTKSANKSSTANDGGRSEAAYGVSAQSNHDNNTDDDNNASTRTTIKKGVRTVHVRTTLMPHDDDDDDDESDDSDDYSQGEESSPSISNLQNSVATNNRNEHANVITANLTAATNNDYDYSTVLNSFAWGVAERMSAVTATAEQQQQQQQQQVAVVQQHYQQQQAQQQQQVVQNTLQVQQAQQLPGVATQLHQLHQSLYDNHHHDQQSAAQAAAAAAFQPFFNL